MIKIWAKTRTDKNMRINELIPVMQWKNKFEAKHSRDEPPNLQLLNKIKEKFR